MTPTGNPQFKLSNSSIKIYEEQGNNILEIRKYTVPLISAMVARDSFKLSVQTFSCILSICMQELDHQRQLAENGLKTSLDGLRKDIEMTEECPLWK